jgi:hypothetical protein
MGNWSRFTFRYANDIDVPSEKLPEKSDPWIANMGIFQDDPTLY